MEILPGRNNNNLVVVVRPCNLANVATDRRPLSNFIERHRARPRVAVVVVVAVNEQTFDEQARLSQG